MLHSQLRRKKRLKLALRKVSLKIVFSFRYLSVIRIKPEAKPDEDDPYADFQIPDDLMW